MESVVHKSDADHQGGGLFTLRSAGDLWAKVEADAGRFWEKSNDHTLFDLVVSLYHLRDWICPHCAGNIKSAKEEHRHWQARTEEERLYDRRFADSDFLIIRELCNTAKHWNRAAEKINSTQVHQGANCGLTRCGDHLGQSYFLVNGRDVRDMIGPSCR